MILSCLLELTIDVADRPEVSGHPIAAARDPVPACLPRGGATWATAAAQSGPGGGRSPHLFPRGRAGAAGQPALSSKILQGTFTKSSNPNPMCSSLLLNYRIELDIVSNNKIEILKQTIGSA